MISVCKEFSLASAESKIKYRIVNCNQEKKNYWDILSDYWSENLREMYVATYNIYLQTWLNHLHLLTQRCHDIVLPKD